MNLEELRLQLVLRCLEQQKDVDLAIQSASRLEAYILGPDGDKRTDGPALAVSDSARAVSNGAVPFSLRATPSRDEEEPGPNGGGPGNGRPSPVSGKADAGATDAAGGEGGTTDGTDTSASAAVPQRKPGRGAGKKNRWTPDAEKILREWWESGQPTERIAAELQRTPASVRERARRLNLRRRKRYRKDEPENDKRGTMPRPPAQTLKAPAGDSRQVTTMSRWLETSKRQGTHAARSGKFRRPSEYDPKPSPVAISALQESRIQRPEVTLTTVINFVRSRDYSVVQSASGEIVVDGRRRFSKDDFIEWANNLRRQMRKPEFPYEVLQEAS